MPYGSSTPPGGLTAGLRHNVWMSGSPARRITTVIFDFDGVIADTERLHLRAFQEVFRERGWQLDEQVYFDRYLGYDDVGLVEAFDRECRLNQSDEALAQLVREKTRLFAAYVDAGDVLFPAARACIGRLASTYRLGIASGALKAEITAILGAAGLLPHCPIIVAADDVTSCKPAPEPYLKAAAALDVSPDQCVAIEDSPAGLSAARTAGMRTIGLTTTAPRALLSDADLVLDGLEQVSGDTIAALASSR